MILRSAGGPVQPKSLRAIQTPQPVLTALFYPTCASMCLHTPLASLRGVAGGGGWLAGLLWIWSRAFDQSVSIG